MLLHVSYPYVESESCILKEVLWAKQSALFFLAQTFINYYFWYFMLQNN